ncbi:MAG: DUF2207 domain-containing protein, partial [Methanosarcinales archaeon]|nr:DUF2207 domain-containing protein [Methanosarcinales archaeon]
MRESKVLAGLLILVLLMGAGGLYLIGAFSSPDLSGPVYVQDYSARLFLNGSMEETFLYRVNVDGKYRMLYRLWKVPVSFQSLGSPHVTPVAIDAPPGTVPYVKDWQGEVRVLDADSGSLAPEIGSLALRDELGVYRPERLSPGLYEIGYRYQIHPFLECDDRHCHLNVMFAEEHLPYQNVTLRIVDPGRDVLELYPHPPMDVSREGQEWVVRGQSPLDRLLEVEMVLNGKA